MLNQFEFCFSISITVNKFRIVVVVVVLLFDKVHEKTKEHKSITVQKDVKEHRITVRFSSQGAPFNLTKF